MSKKYVPSRYTLLLLILAFGAGAGVAVFYLQIRHFMRDMFGYELKHEDSAIRERIRSMRIELPEQAWNINLFYQQGGPDVQCWVAFSASPEDIKKTIDTLYEYCGDKEYVRNEPYPPKDYDGNAIKWWDEMPPDVKPYKGTLFWAGHDEKNSRLYIFRMTI